MKRVIITVLISLIAFFVSFIAMQALRYDKQKEITVEVEAVYNHDDVFQLFYMHDEETYFSEERSVIKNIVGMSKLQTISISFPIDKNVRELRLDISNNVHQDSIQIKDIRIVSEGAKESVLDLFIGNKYLEQNQNVYTLKSVDNVYDPFLVSDFDVPKLINQLSVCKVFSTKISFLFSLIIAIVVFVSLKIRNKKIDFSTGYVVLFSIILLFPSLMLFFPIEEKTLNENRSLAQKPKFSISKEYSTEYENYYNDNLCLIGQIKTLLNEFKMTVFQSSTNPEKVLFGYDDFLFLSNIYSSYSSYSHRDLMSSAELDSLSNKFLDRKLNLNKKGIAYFCGFWPNKHTIYADKLPEVMKIQINGKMSLADQVINTFQKNKIKFFDVRETLKEKKTEKQLYLKLDTHWNMSGVYYAYKSFFVQLYNEFGVKPFDEAIFDITYHKEQVGDLVGVLGVDSLNIIDNVPIYKIKDGIGKISIVPSDGLPKLTVTMVNYECKTPKTVLIFGDSFSENIQMFLSMHFQKVIRVDLSRESRYYDSDIVEKVNPDIVISACVERYLPYLLKS